MIETNEEVIADEEDEIGLQPQDLLTSQVPALIDEVNKGVETVSEKITWPVEEDNKMQVNYFDATKEDPQTNPIEMFMQGPDGEDGLPSLRFNSLVLKECSFTAK